MNKKTVKITGSLAGKRIDLALVDAEIGLSRRKIRSIIDHGGCYVNRKRIRVASKKLNVGDDVELIYSEGSIVHKKNEFNLSADEIIFESNTMIAVNKACGIPAVATQDQSLVHVAALARKFFEAQGKKYGAIEPAHRLDMETTGVMVLGTDHKNALFLQDEFRLRNTKKVYHAVCYGIPDSKKFDLDCQLSVIDKRTRMVRVVEQGGKQATTSFRVLKSNKELGISLIECAPITGRTHQLRVQLTHLGLPILGDKKYGRIPHDAFPKDLSEKLSKGHLLHARYLTIKPGKNLDPVQLSGPYFDDFKQVCLKAKLIYEAPADLSVVD